MNRVKRFLPVGAVLLLFAAAAKDARGGNFVILREGTPVVVRLTADFDPRASQAGGAVSMAAAEKVTHEGHTLIAAEAPVAAVFTPVGMTTEGVGFLRITSVQGTDGQDVALRPTAGTAEPAGENGGAGKDPAGIRAGTERLPAGKTFRVYVDETAFIEE